MKIERRNRHDFIAVDNLTVLVAKQNAIRIAVMTDAGVRAGDPSTMRWISSGYMLPHESLILIPLGSLCAIATSAPSSRKTQGVDL